MFKIKRILLISGFFVIFSLIIYVYGIEYGNIIIKNTVYEQSRIEVKVNENSGGLETVVVPICNFKDQECQNKFNCFCKMNENDVLEFIVTFGWVPPDPERPICTWVDPNTLPLGATYPTMQGLGEATSTFTWTPNFCQAGPYSVVFYGNGDCFDYANSGNLAVGITVNNLNRAPVLEVDQSFITARHGETVRVNFFALDTDAVECRDDSLSAKHSIEPTPTIPSTMSFDENTGTGFVEWRTTSSDVGLHTLTTIVNDNYGALAQGVTNIDVTRDREKITNVTYGHGINLTYVGNCSENCTKIVFLQTVCRFALIDDGTVQPFKPSDKNPARLPQDTDTVNGGARLCSVDYIVGEADPYYNGDDGSDKGSGNQMGNHTGNYTLGNITNSTISDEPETGDSALRRMNKSLHDSGTLAANQNVNGTRLEFETCAFCAEGPKAGTIYRCVRWDYTRYLGDADSGKSKAVGVPTNYSLKFDKAVKKWGQNAAHAFNTPGFK